MGLGKTHQVAVGSRWFASSLQDLNLICAAVLGVCVDNRRTALLTERRTGVARGRLRDDAVRGDATEESDGGGSDQGRSEEIGEVRHFSVFQQACLGTNNLSVCVRGVF